MVEEKKDLEIVTESKAVLLQGDPEAQLAFAQKSSSALMAIMRQKPKKVMINGEQYLEFEDWQTVARFYGASVGVEWTKIIIRDDKVFGYEARAYVKMGGEIISNAESACMRDEPKWDTRAVYEWENNKRKKIGDEPVPEFQLRSMAQTRASAKALRNVFAWVVVLAGFRPTPSEEMPLEQSNYQDQDQPPFPSKPSPREQAPKAGTKEIDQGDGNVLICSVENCDVELSEKVAQYSMQKFGEGLCFDHQKGANKNG